MEDKKLVKIWEDLKVKVEKAKRGYNPIKYSSLNDVLGNLMVPMNADVEIIEIRGIPLRENFSEEAQKDILSLVTYLRLLRQYPKFREQETQVRDTKVKEEGYRARDYPTYCKQKLEGN